MCGIVGVSDSPQAAALALEALQGIQSRGEEAAGITVRQTFRTLKTVKGPGLITEVFPDSIVRELLGNAAIAHNRYGTAGGISPKDAHPFQLQTINGEQAALAHNGTLTNVPTIRDWVKKWGGTPQGATDSETMAHFIARYPQKDLVSQILFATNVLEGAYSLIVLNSHLLIAVRDPWGFRPLEMGETEDGATVFASETCALDVCHAKWLRSVEPGEMIVVRDKTRQSYRFYGPNTPPVTRKQCIFEHVYFSRPDSIVFGQLAEEVRFRMGEHLFMEQPAENIDYVVGVADSGLPAAQGYANSSGFQFKLGLIRNHYIGRTFIQPSQGMRANGVRLKHNPLKSLEGSNIVLVDDSIVRGTTSKRIVSMLKEVGVRQVHLRIACPPTIWPCFYGVDTPDRGELIAANKNVEEIRDYIGCDSLGYLSLNGLQQAIGGNPGEWCTACYTGKYPTHVEHLLQIQPTPQALG